MHTDLSKVLLEFFILQLKNAQLKDTGLYEVMNSVAKSVFALFHAYPFFTWINFTVSDINNTAQRISR